ncbi:uncharacterized protein LOC118185689 [Stegodyphus dumicola]|uniref:uncharacterized protein LOC118185689 n=1 Tax=Stegodyphus dumicola TaxID=202533 RepID=UPI0015AF6D22|nr:uncharacterized protein LOC118185689 [Stegodyphus dumicola]
MSKEVLTKKKVLKSNITTFKAKVNSNLEQAEILEVKLFETKLNAFNSELRSIYEEIFLLCPEKDCDTFITEQQTIQETLDELWITINKKLQKLSSDSVIETSSVAKVNSSDVRLPKLELSTFTGENIDEWISFYDLFKASVDNNPNISKCQKFQYLKASCKKKALSIIESIPISDANYDIALQLLQERYSNKRELTNALIRKMFNLPNVSDSAQAILHCVDVVNECVYAL